VRAGDELRAFLARILGWSNTSAVELALISVTLAAAGCTTLVLCGQGDIVPIAWALHRRVREPGRPFIVAATRRGDHPESVRSPASRGNAVLALEAARRGTCCMRLRRAPADLAETVPLLRAADDVMLVICCGPHLASDALLIRPAPVVVPPLASRAHELDRIIVEYAGDAIAALGAPHEAFTADDRAWVRDHAAGSLAEIEKATLRLVTLYTSRNLSHAAARLGMAPVSLSRWLGRRELPR
jgi:predicted transcriptional regulator